jgi:hypothetical protein
VRSPEPQIAKTPAHGIRGRVFFMFRFRTARRRP